MLYRLSLWHNSKLTEGRKTNKFIIQFKFFGTLLISWITLSKIINPKVPIMLKKHKLKEMINIIFGLKNK